MPPKTIAVVVFPGSNCDHDAYYALKEVFGQQPRFCWHSDRELGAVDAVILPGGFSYGDYLRSGAIARFSPIMSAVQAFAEAGKPVLGICNGFQILLEAGLLPGAMQRNRDLKFICDDVHLRVENPDTPFTRACGAGAVLRVPIAHHDGNYYADDATLDRLEANRQVVFRYCTPEGAVTGAGNPNGSRRGIAGIINDRGNVLGMMPHPERCADPALGNTDGAQIFHSLLQSLTVAA